MSINWFNESDHRSLNKPNTSASPALEQFLQSMHIGFIEWHDGIGYDLDALKELEPQELRDVETLLISRKNMDWRDVEALAALNTHDTIDALKECLHSNNNDVKLFAVKHLKEMNVVDSIDDVIVETLPETKIGDGLSYALSLAEKYPSERIKQKILWCCLYGNDDIRIHCAAMMLYLYGKASTSFDTNQKIVFEFREQDRSKRIIPFLKLCQQIGVDAGSVINK